MNSGSFSPGKRRPLLLILLSLFFGFGVFASGTATLLLLIPGTPLDILWRVNPRGYQGFITMGNWSLLLLLSICALCGTAAAGLWRLQSWGYRLAISILCINLIGDTINSFLLRDWRTVIGLPIAGLMIAYLVMNRKLFAP
jgi:hypothetical protein